MENPARCFSPSSSGVLILALVLIGSTSRISAQKIETSPIVTGYRGIWFDLGQRSKYGSKYSGGLGTYTAKHIPLAVHAPAVGKTFFVYGGTPEDGQRHLLAMIGYYDHKRGVVPKPVVVHDKHGVDDPHDNPSLGIDDAGHLWVFVSGRARKRPGYVYRSRNPYDIESFEQVREDEFTYPQPWWIRDRGFLLLFTKYTEGRELYWRTISTQRAWSPSQKLAGMGGHYQISFQKSGRIITAFNMHPSGNVDHRTNLYLVQTDDFGRTWKTVGGRHIQTPMEDSACPALVRDYRAEGRLVYLKDVGLDSEGNPVVLHITSGQHQPGPGADPRYWTIAHWKGLRWIFHRIILASHNYDMGSLYLEPNGTWRLIAPTGTGPQPHGTGGEMAMWISRDEGQSWNKTGSLTKSSLYNHAYARRPVNAHPEFYAFWADGNPDQISPSRLYFTNQSGDRVFNLPETMEGMFERPVLMPFPFLSNQ